MNIVTRAPFRVRHENALHLARTVFAEPISPRMRRITLQAPEFAGFTSGAADDHVKLFFPPPGQAEPTLPILSAQGVSFPAGMPKPIARDYTPRRFDPKACELTIEFVLHEDGPASNWAAHARPGDVLGIGGPRGSLIVPEDYDAYLLIGDETALPAIGRRLEEMRPGSAVIAIIEVADRHEERHLATAANAEMIWLHRDGKPAGRSGLLEAALRQLRLPTNNVFAWASAEIEVARSLRNYLMEEAGLPRSQIKAAGYWKIGEAGAHGKLD
jgi:NADPH-dependent ferric siderophore reductase